MSHAAALYIVPTPIGNLNDISQRALETLQQVDFIACEDTRHTAKLLSHYQISTPTWALHDHNEQHKSEQLVGRLLAARAIALVSDAGTPLDQRPRLSPGQPLSRSRCPGDCPARPLCRHHGPVGGRPADRPLRVRRISAGQGQGPPRQAGKPDRTRAAPWCFTSPPVACSTRSEAFIAGDGGERRLVVARELTKTFESHPQPAGRRDADEWLMGG
jgi:16S rRNA (cytidine1402-2'-O)-methyltransferase